MRPKPQIKKSKPIPLKSHEDSEMKSIPPSSKKAEAIIHDNTYYTTTWQKKRLQWFKVNSYYIKQDVAKQRETPYCLIQSAKSLPIDEKAINRMKDTMKSYYPPYTSFNNFYKLKDIVELYQEVWDEGSDDD